MTEPHKIDITYVCLSGTEYRNSRSANKELNGIHKTY